MIKNLLLGLLFSLVVIGLIIGGVNRTLGKFAQVTEYNEPQPLNMQERAAYSHGDDYDHAHDHDHDHDGAHRLVPALADWETLPTVVYETRPNGIWLRSDDGREVRIRRAAWEYAHSQGFMVEKGDRIILTGYQIDAEFDIGSMRSEVNGLTVALRDDNGRPLWSMGDQSHE